MRLPFPGAGFKAEIGYDLGRENWHQGYMSEALRAMLAYGFETLELDRIEALVMPENEASAVRFAGSGSAKKGSSGNTPSSRDGITTYVFSRCFGREAGQTLRVLNP